MTYKDVHFRLASGYEWGKGLDEKKSNAFSEEITSLFKQAGWDIKEPKYSSSCLNATKEKNRIYLHPIDLSGEILEDLIPEVEKILSQGNTFKHVRTDVYRDLIDMEDSEYQVYLESKRNEIELDLLEGFKTKRKNLYITNWIAIIERVKEKYRLERIQNHIGRSSSDPEWRYVEKVFGDLKEQGKFVIAETKHGKGYRTAA